MVTIRPAVSFMAFPLANALSFSGVTLLVGALLGPPLLQFSIPTGPYRESPSS